MANITVGTRVYGPHGFGTVVEVRRATTYQSYLQNPRSSEIVGQLAAVAPGLLVEAFYDSTRYPYRITFDTGYTDVYGPNELDFDFHAEALARAEANASR